MKQFFKKSLLEFVALSTTIHSCRIAYLHLDTVLFIFIVLYLCFSSVSACLMQRIELFTQWNKNLLNDFRPVFSVDVFLNVEEESDASFFFSTKHLHVPLTYYECGGHACKADMGSLDVPGTGWVWAVWRGNSRVWEHTRQVCTAYVVTWCL